jgi:two-component system, NtrC family, sensor histidine kinase HydH
MASSRRTARVTGAAAKEMTDNENRPPAQDTDPQAQLLQAERLAAMGRMAALLAHQIRTPLASIGGFARRLVRSTPPDDPRREELQIIVTEVARLERLIEEVLGFTRISRTCFQPLDLNTEISSLLLTLEEEIHQRGIAPELRLDTGLPPATADASQIRQALTNLIVNAMEAMPEGGQLTVTTCHDGEYVEIGVSDNGVGIRPQDRERLFAPFFTTKVSGTGLGLYVVSQVVENHRGSIGIESESGGGSTFRVRLPVKPF